MSYVDWRLEAEALFQREREERDWTAELLKVGMRGLRRMLISTFGLYIPKIAPATDAKLADGQLAPVAAEPEKVFDIEELFVPATRLWGNPRMIQAALESVTTARAVDRAVKDETHGSFLDRIVDMEPVLQEAIAAGDAAMSEKDSMNDALLELAGIFVTDETPEQLRERLIDGRRKRTDRSPRRPG